VRRVKARLTDNAAANRDIIRRHLADRAVEVRLPKGRFPLAPGCVVGAGRSLRGRDTVLVASTTDPTPLFRILGSGATIADLTFELPAADTGLHDGDQGTAVTIGQYLYPAATDWIDDVEVARVRLLRAGRCAANSIAVMGAVRRVRLVDIDVSGGGTAIAVHWGAVGQSVATIVGPSYHPHDLNVAGLTVRDAFEAFYLSSVHDVSVRDVTAANVEIGFRLLPGDNVDHYHEDGTTSQVSSRIDIADCRVGWCGLYGVRVAGWGRSEVDHRVRRLDYRGVSIRNVRLHAEPALHRRHDGRRAGVVVDQATGVAFADVKVGGSGDGVAEAIVNGSPTTIGGLLSNAAH
jgi:hypothetical protein